MNDERVPKKAVKGYKKQRKPLGRPKREMENRVERTRSEC
jgi:hypothetical protein